MYLDAVMKSREVQQNFDHNTRKMLRKNKNKRGNTEKNVDRLVEVSGNSIETGPVPNEYFGVFSSPGFSAGAFLKSPFAVDKVPDIQLTVFPTVSVVLISFSTEM